MQDGARPPRAVAGAAVDRVERRRFRGRGGVRLRRGVQQHRRPRLSRPRRRSPSRSRSTGTTRSSPSPSSTADEPSIRRWSPPSIWTRSPSTGWACSSCGAAMDEVEYRPGPPNVLRLVKLARGRDGLSPPRRRVSDGGAPGPPNHPGGTLGTTGGRGPGFGGEIPSRLGPWSSDRAWRRKLYRGYDRAADPRTGRRRARGEDEIQGAEETTKETILEIDGTLDAVTAPDLRAVVDQLVAERRKSVTLELSVSAPHRQLRRRRHRLAVQAHPSQRRAGQDRRPARSAARHLPPAASRSRLSRVAAHPAFRAARGGAEPGSGEYDGGASVCADPWADPMGAAQRVLRRHGLRDPVRP